MLYYIISVMYLSHTNLRYMFVGILGVFYMQILSHHYTRHNILITGTVKPVCNDHLYHKIYYLWLIQ